MDRDKKEGRQAGGKAEMIIRERRENRDRENAAKHMKKRLALF